MPLKIVRKDHVEIPGRGYVLLTTPHAAGPNVDLYMGQILEEAALLSKCHAVIGKAGREYLDPNRIQFADSELRKSIQTFLEEENAKCILDIRAKKEPGVDIRTARGESGSQLTTAIVKTRLARDFKISVDADYKGLDSGSLITTFSKKDSQRNFAIEAVAIEFGLEEKTLGRDKVIEDIADIVGLINRELGFSESDQGSSNALD